MRVSFMEIYNEVIVDLLNPSSGPLKVHEDLEKGVFVGDLKEEVVVSSEQVLNLLANGECRPMSTLMRSRDSILTTVVCCDGRSALQPNAMLVPRT